MTRGVDGTAGSTHDSGATVTHSATARDFREPQEHIAAESGVHGVSGDVVGTTDSQFLSNKTLVTPTIAADDWTNADHNHADSTRGGKLAQSSTHESPDTDAGSSSLHHTLGTGANQAAAGNHDHSGVYSLVSHTHSDYETDIAALETDVAALQTATDDSGWVTSSTGWTIAAGWTLTSVGYRKVGDQVTLIWSAERTGATVSAFSQGNIVDQTVFSAIPAGIRPSNTMRGLYTLSDSFGTYILAPSGALSIVTLHANAEIASGTTISGQLTFLI